MDDAWSKAELAEFRQRLLDRQAELTRVTDQAAEGAQTVTLDQTRVGRLSRMDALQAQAMTQETIRRRQIEAQRITAALARMERGEYGECQACGELIAKPRLRVDPGAVLCIACAEATG